jgi:integrase
MASKQLTAAQVGALSKPGSYRIEEGLYLRIVGNSRTYSFRYSRHSKEHWKSIGPAHSITLAEARAKAAEWRSDLLNKREPGKTPQRMDFATLAKEAVKSITAGLTASTRGNWEYSMKLAGEHFGKIPVAEIAPRHVADFLANFWTTQPVRAEIHKTRLNRVFEYAVAHSYTTSNPASHATLKALLGKLRRPETKHFKAMPFREVPGLARMLLERRKDDPRAQALLFIVLSPLRSGNAAFLDWSEVDLKAGVMRFEAGRMKKRRKFELPLSRQARALLEELDGKTGRVFEGMDQQKILKYLRKITGDKTITVHGLRTSFASFCQDRDMPDLTIEAVLSHIDSNKTRAAYRAPIRPEKLLKLLDAWGRYVIPPVEKPRGERVRASSWMG